jgi:hypothetical protein
MGDFVEGLSGLIAYLTIDFSRKKVNTQNNQPYPASASNISPARHRPPHICITGISPQINVKDKGNLDHVLTEKKLIMDILEQMGFVVEYILHESNESGADYLLSSTFSLLVSVGPLLTPRLAGAISLDMHLSTAYNAREMNMIYSAALSLISQAGFDFELCYLLRDEHELRSAISAAEKSDTAYFGLELSLTYEYIMNIRNILLPCAIAGVIISFIQSFFVHSQEFGISQFQFIYAIGLCAWCLISTKFWKQKCSQLTAITNPNSLISHFSKSAPSIGFDSSDKKSVINNALAAIGIIAIGIVYLLLQVWGLCIYIHCHKTYIFNFDFINEILTKIFLRYF